MFGEELKKVRAKSVLIHNMTNSVTIKDVGNVQLADGASPVMASGIDAIEITEHSDGLNINTGRYDGNATYRNRIIDAIYHMKAEVLEEVNYVLF